MLPSIIVFVISSAMLKAHGGPAGTTGSDSERAVHAMPRPPKTSEWTRSCTSTAWQTPRSCARMWSPGRVASRPAWCVVLAMQFHTFIIWAATPKKC